MKRIVILTLIFMLAITIEVKAEKAWATAYCKSGTTASGTTTTEHRTVAGKREWFGKTIHIWLDDGSGEKKPENYIGKYIVEDTGGTPIRQGRVIDIYMPSREDCKQFGGRRIIFEFEGEENGTEVN